MPDDPDPLHDIVFILRTGALFPVYRTFSLLERLKGRVLTVPTVLVLSGGISIVRPVAITVGVLAC